MTEKIRAKAKANQWSEAEVKARREYARKFPRDAAMRAFRADKHMPK